ncbi:TPA: hypothetical protein ACU15Y_004322 [Escherichia coli]|uniref:hypothetical protein n=1 Tax=Escherichia coli TaxID=562 RepID=UPI00333E438B
MSGLSLLNICPVRYERFLVFFAHEVMYNLDAVRFNRHKINRQLSRLDLASPVLEPEVIWLGRRR